MNVPELVFLAGGSILAASKGICPDPQNPECKPWLKGIVFGLIAAFLYYIIFIGIGNAIECCDYLAMLVTAYLLGHAVKLVSKG